MKRSLHMMALAVVTLLLGGCTAMMNSSSYGSSDLYISDNRERVARDLMADAEAAAEIAAQAESFAAQSRVDYTTVLADDYQSAYARRLQGFTSPTYQLPSSYYSLSTSEAMYYASAYDPAFYNVMVSGDQVWVEPKYITSMFGTWGATNVTYGLYSDPWTYGWSYYTDPFYYSWWGYPRYSWSDWNWTICYGPYWGPGYYPYYPGYYPYYPYYPGYYPIYPPHHPAPPPHRPGKPHHPDGGKGNLNGHRDNTGSRYTSPTSNRNYGASQDNRRPGGAVSTGINEHRTTVRPSNGGGTTQRGTRVDGGTQQRTNNNFRSSGSTSTRRNTSVGQGTTTHHGSTGGLRGGSSGGHGGGSRGGTTSSRR